MCADINTKSCIHALTFCTQGMVDCGGDVTLTPEEFLSAAQQCLAIEKAVQRQELGAEIVRELEALSLKLSRSMVGDGWSPGYQSWQASKQGSQARCILEGMHG
jgi:hypothetical protein